MDDCIIFSNINDFIFCPASIYFHNLYGSRETITYQSHYQINGTKAHESVDTNTYSTKKEVITSMEVYCEKYKIVGKIDLYDMKKKLLVERKREIKNIYDGYIFQLYAQYFSLVEMGFPVNQLKLYSMVDNKSYSIPLPEEDNRMKRKFEETLNQMRTFDLCAFEQMNKEKCKKCIYYSACDRGGDD